SSDGRDEHEGKQTKTQGRMRTTRKAGAGFVRVTICFHLISALLPKLKQRGLYLVRKRFNAVGFSSNEIKLGHGFHLRNFDRISRQARMAHVAATGPVLFASRPAF